MISSAFGITNLLVVSLVGAGNGLPLGLPPASEDPVMAKIAPEKCLAYVSWAGSAEPKASSENHLEQLLAEPEVQALLSGVESMLVKAIEQASAEEGPEAEEYAKLATKWGKRLLHQPAAFYLESFAFDPRRGPDMRGGVIVNVGDDAAELKKQLNEMLDGFGLERVDVAGVEMHQVQPDPEAPIFTVGVKENYFYLGIGKGAVEGMLERAKTDAPAWLTDLRKKLSVDRTSLVAYGNAKEIVGTSLEIAAAMEPDVAEIGPEKILALLGLDSISSVGVVCGLDQSGYVSRVLAKVDGPSKGLLTLIDGKPLTAADLSPIPHDATVGLAARFDTAKAYDKIFEIAGKIDPRAPEEMREELGDIEEALGMSLRDDILAALGDTWCVYHSSGEGGYLGGFAATVTIKDRATVDKLQAKLNEMIGMFGERGPTLRGTKFASHTIYSVTGIERDFPLAPSWCVADDRLIVAMMPHTIKAYLGRDDAFQSIAEVPQVASALADAKPFKLYYQDTPRLFDQLYGLLLMGARYFSVEMAEEGIDFDLALMPSGSAIRPHLKPDVITVSRTEAGIEVTSRECFPGSGNGLSLVALGAVGFLGYQTGAAEPIAFTPAAAREMESKNNMKMIGIAMHNYHDTYGHFPPAYSTDPDGKPLLSWRVLILPFVEQEALYRSFKLDEPWDSEHNRKLIAELPHVYKTPGSKAEAGVTNYLTVRQKNSAFPGKEKLRLASITDGTSNTVMVLEVSDAAAVTWSKPDDFVPPMDPASGIAGLRRNGFLAVACDGAAHKIKADIDRDKLKALFGRNDGQLVDWSEITDRGAHRRDRVDFAVEEAKDEARLEAVPDTRRDIPEFRGEAPDGLNDKPEPDDRIESDDGSQTRDPAADSPRK